MKFEAVLGGERDDSSLVHWDLHEDAAAAGSTDLAHEVAELSSERIEAVDGCCAEADRRAAKAAFGPADDRAQLSSHRGEPA